MKAQISQDYTFSKTKVVGVNTENHKKMHKNKGHN